MSPEAPQTQATPAPATGDRSFLTVILLWFFIGGFGAYRMYLKRVWSGLAIPFLLFSAAVTGFFYPPGLFMLGIPVWIWGHVDMILILTGVLKVRGNVALVGITGGLKALGWVFFSLNFVFGVFFWIYNFSLLAEQQGESPWSVIQADKPYYEKLEEAYTSPAEVPEIEFETGGAEDDTADGLDDGGDEVIALPELLPFVVPDYPGGTTLVVSSDEDVRYALESNGYATYSVIQNAIEAASAGDTIFVDAGYYYESLTFEYKSGLRLIGRGEVHIIARHDADVVYIDECNDLVFENLLLRHQVNTDACGKNVFSIYGYADRSRNILITRCDINGCGFIGVSVGRYGSGIRIENSTIHDCEIGIYDESGLAVTTAETYMYSNRQFDYATIENGNDIEWPPD